MTFLSVASLIIPGYEALSQEERSAFEKSSSGGKFSALIHSVLDGEKTKKSSWLWNRLSGKTKQQEQESQNRFDAERKKFLAEISMTSEYKTILIHLTHNALNKEIPDFNLLNAKQQLMLSQSEFSQKLYESLVVVDEALARKEHERSQLGLWARLNSDGQLIKDEFLKVRKDILARWNNEFQSHTEMAPLRKTIEDAKKVAHQQKTAKKLAELNEHATQLSQSVPLLNYRKSKTAEPIIKQLRAKYVTANGDAIADPVTLEQQELTDVLFYCMQQVSQMEITFINLDVFNKEQAKRLATDVLKSFNDKSFKFNLDHWFKEYERRLYRSITGQLLLIKGKEWQEKQTTFSDMFNNSLSYLWSTRPATAANEFLRKMGDAHGFIQATSFSTQNESSILAVLDVYNYSRHYEQISEVQSIFSSLMSPLRPLYNEYRDIALYEKNKYWKSLRSLMPILIVVGFIVLIAVALGPLALPDLAFAAVFIPAFILGLAIANLYVSYKNEIYNSFRELYYGGPFEIPEFQVNTRMLNAFGNENNANRVREFYVDLLKHCDHLEQDFKAKHELGVLSDEDIAQRKANITTRHQAALEWYDIHSNKELNFKEAPKIVLARLQQIGDQEYVLLQKVLKEEQDSIRTTVTEVVTDIQSTIESHNKIPVFEQGQELEATTIKAHYRYGLFQSPRCLDVKARMEHLVEFSEQISVARA